MKTTFLSSYRKAQTPEQTHFCPGCGHGNVLKFVDEVICELGLPQKAVWVSPVGCGGLTDSYLSISHILSAHGRASAVASAFKRIHPNALVIVSQGDGDLASIGFLEAIHAANRGENLTVLFMNNANFAMTGGQMAPTSMLGQRTPTSPLGRSFAEHGSPLKVCEILNQLDAPAFIARVAIGSENQLIDAQKTIKKAIQNQVDGRGYSFVEILSPCPSNWHCTPVDARNRVVNEMVKTFPLGVFRDESRHEVISLRNACKPYLPTDVLNAYEMLAKPVSVSELKPLHIQNPLSVCCAGFGGQGILTLGRIIAQLALTSGLEATWIPSYGPEMRGGVANCFVRIDCHSISSPVVEHPDVILAMNQPALEKFLNIRAPDGVVFYDADNAQPTTSDLQNVFPVHASSIAEKLKIPRCTNLILLKSWLQFIHADMETVVKSLNCILPHEMALCCNQVFCEID